MIVLVLNPPPNPPKPKAMTIMTKIRIKPPNFFDTKFFKGFHHFAINILICKKQSYRLKYSIMTNKYMYFIANWKMFGDLRSLNSLDSSYKVFKF